MDAITAMPARAVKFGDRIYGPHGEFTLPTQPTDTFSMVLSTGPDSRDGKRVRLWTGPDSYWSVPWDDPVAVRIPLEAVELREELTGDYPEGCWAVELLGGDLYRLCTGEAEHDGPHNQFGVPFDQDRTAA